MDNGKVLSLIAMDLKRVALGLHSKSYKTAERFLNEALKHKEQLQLDELAPYLRKILNSMELLGKREESLRAEEALLLSVRIQNYLLHKVRQL